MALCGAAFDMTRDVSRDGAVPASPRWLGLGLLAWVALLGCYESNDGDLGFHLATGREILRSGRIPARNVLSFTEPDQPWLLHQGLPAVVFEWLWQHTGPFGLQALKLALLVTTWAFTYAAARALEVTRLAAALSCMLAATASAFRFELRPYLFTHLTLAIIVWVLAALGSGRMHPTRALLTAAAALCAGAQLHAGAVDGAILLTVYGFTTLLVSPTVRPAASPPDRVDHGASARLRATAATRLAAASGRRLGLVSLAACGLGLLGAAAGLALYHPLGVRVLLFPWQMATAGYWGEHLVEFRRAWLLPFAPLAAYWGWLGLVTAVVVTAFRRLPLGLCAGVVVYAALSLWFVRMVYAFAIIAVPVTAVGLELGGRQLKQRVKAARDVAGLPALGLVAVLALAFVYRDHQLGVGISSRVWPSEQYAFVRAHGLRGRAFVSDAWAGTFLAAFYPARQSFFDNRLEAYSTALARDVYQTIRYGAPGWDRWLDHYAVQFLVLRYTTPSEAKLARGADNVRQRLVRDPRYALVYFDDDGELFVRAQGDNAALARSHAITGVDPDRHRFLGRPSAAAASLLRAADSGMRSDTALGLTALALADSGDLHHARQLAGALHARSPDAAFARVVVQRIAATPH
ncbi:MAG: hypothetical protein ABW321_31145 [Polyangiales bacterium]